MARPDRRLDGRVGEIVVKKVLMIAYHYPPMSASSGFQRTLRFAEYLPEQGWLPSILTVHPRAYPGHAPAGPEPKEANGAKGANGANGAFAANGANGASSASGAPAGGADPRVRRAFAFDAARHLSVFGRYPQWLSIPDRWWSWWLGAVPAGLAMIREQKPDVIWSTYPIATAHAIGHTLSRATGIPWGADFRDPMAQEGYPPEPAVHRAFERIEERTLRRCARAVFTTRGTQRLYAERYPDVPAERLAVIENGYDEAAFVAAGSGATNGHAGGSPAVRGGPVVLVHSGTIYESERDPRALFAALSELKRAGAIGAGTLRVVLRATGCDDWLRELLAPLGIDDVVRLEPPLGYRDALGEMLAADGLLVLQAANCNYQVPAKLYEYLRARRPILALTDAAGDTARTLLEAGIDTIAPLDSKERIAAQLLRFLDLVRDARAPLADPSRITAASRRSRTAELARQLEAVS
jgi:glycosyltransferase involved in cell wall biosynthesis